MDTNLEDMEQKFENVINIRNQINSVFCLLDTNISKIKYIYMELLNNSNNNQKSILFGLDSFQFQGKLLDMENTDLKRMFLVLNNRMYCEYYKLYKIIIEYIKYNIINKKTTEYIKLINNFPIYKDLEPYKQYDFEITIEIHNNIIILLNEINNFIMNKDVELKKYQEKQEKGLNINNFVSSFNYDIMIVKEKYTLFKSYLDFFHHLHLSQFEYFLSKLNLLQKQILEHINIENNNNNNNNNIIINKIEEKPKKRVAKMFKKVVNIFKTNKKEEVNDVEDNSISSFTDTDNNNDTNIISSSLLDVINDTNNEANDTNNEANDTNNEANDTNNEANDEVNDEANVITEEIIEADSSTDNPAIN